MKVGDRVKWTSQSRGNITTKHGVIVEIVPSGLRIDHAEKSDLFRHDPLTIRYHESYIVCVGNKYYYWPLVKNLVQIK